MLKSVPPELPGKISKTFVLLLCFNTNFFSFYVKNLKFHSKRLFFKINAKCRMRFKVISIKKEKKNNEV